MCDYDFDTPLHHAAIHGHIEIVAFLVDRAPKIGSKKAISPRDRWGVTPLGLAITRKNKKCEGLLRAAGGDEIGSLSAARSRSLIFDIQKERGEHTGEDFNWDAKMAACDNDLD